jgi:dephospho-CoA kinase
VRRGLRPVCGRRPLTASASQLVFSDAAARGIKRSYPPSGEWCAGQAKRDVARGLDIPLLLEARLPGATRASRTASIRHDRGLRARRQIERQVARDGATREHAAERVRAQLSIEEKRKLADHVIDNSGTLAATERQVRELYAKLTASEEGRG